MSPLRRPPGPRSLLPGANILAMRRDPLGFLTQLAREHGDVVRFTIGGQPIYLVNHPDHIRDLLVTDQRQFAKGRGLERARVLLGQGLLTSEGELHRRQRRLAQPAFHRERIAGYGAVMAECAARRSAGWPARAELEVHREMMRITLAVVGKTLFDADIEGEAEEIGEALTTSLALFNHLMLPFADWLARIPIGPGARFARAKARLDRTIFRMIDDRRRNGGDRGDLLSMLLLAQDEERPGPGMSDRQLRDEAITLLLAGHETTANALTWTLYLLSQHPAETARLEAEVDRALEGRLPTAGDLSRLEYATRVMTEAMRLYPPAWIIGRRALEDWEVGGFEVPRRSIVLASQYLIHRDARFFPQPDRFDPERWTEAAKSTRPKFSYFPFGAGSRICIGEQFAWMEGVLILATLVQRWRFRLAAGQRVALAPSVTLRPRYGMGMVVEERRSGPEADLPEAPAPGSPGGRESGG